MQANDKDFPASCRQGAEACRQILGPEQGEG